MEKRYTTSLETLQHDVGAILNEKLKATSPEATVDYVGFALDNLDANIARAKDAKKELDAYIKEQTHAKETIKEGTAKWLADNGIDKLEGMRVSSLTIHEPAPSVKLVIHDRNCELFKNPDFIKTSLDETAIKNFLINSEFDYSEFAELETVNKQPQIKVNRKR